MFCEIPSIVIIAVIFMIMIGYQSAAIEWNIGVLSTQRKIEADINKLSVSGKYISDKVVENIAFGFLSYMFNKVPFRKGG